MKTEFNFENSKVGDKVYHVVWGWVNISVKEKKYFEVFNCPEPFLMNGKRNLLNINPTIYPYNPFEQNQERVVEVKVKEQDEWAKRVLIAIKKDYAICWSYSETIEESKTEVHTYPWNYWREIQEPQKELTQEEKINILWEKYGKEL